MNKKCLLIDSYGFIFRAFHVQPPLTAPDGTPVGAVYGFTSMLIKLLQDHNPTHVAAVFDHGGKNFRHELFKEYKAHRPEVPESLIPQFPITREVVSSFNLKPIELNGYEADDIIATLAKQISAKGEEVIVVSSDKDLAQLMSDKIKIFDPVKGRFITEENIIEKFGVKPDKIRDVLAIIGDKSDNIPGVPGFGPKTASDLINQFGDFNNLVASYSEINSERKRNLFKDNIELAKLSYELVTLKDNLDLQLTENDLVWEKPDSNKLQRFLNKYGFKSLANRATKIALITNTPQFTFDSFVLHENEPIITNLSSDSALLNKCALDSGYISLLADGENLYIESNKNIFQLPLKEPALKNLFEDESILKILYNIKIYNKLGLNIKSYADLSIMAYDTSAGLEQLSLPELTNKYSNLNSILPSEICNKISDLYQVLYQKLVDENSLSIYLDIDLPISKILNRIENIGVKFDIVELNKLSKEFAEILEDLQLKIFSIAGQEFNIGSPKQLGEILFDILKLPGASKSTKSGAYSTSVDILEELSAQGYEIANYLLKWRQISKLKNTYSDSLPKMVNQNTGRIHTTLLQTSTATGRLSSIEPNLQNIPIKTKEGERIRRAVVPESGSKLISADYSQIELRILAEIADIKDLKEAFHHDIDIHSKTASQVFNIDISEVTPEQRRKAKAINFGIIYGISSFGLAHQLGISRKDAQNYITKYFAAYPGIKEYMERTKKFAASHGYVENYIGRKCFVPTINSSNHALRSFAERAAINAPIQGAASDIVKIAMIKVDRMLTQNSFATKVILQVHDELLFEAPESEIEKVTPLIKKAMENVITFETRLKVDIECSNYWA